MQRLRRLDRALVLVLTPLWLACFGLTLTAMVRGAWHPGFHVERTADYPLVSHRRPYGPPGSVLPGDRILRVGEVDVRGLGPFAFMERYMAAAPPEGVVPLVVDRAGARLELESPGVSNALFWPFLPAAVAGFAVVTLLLLRTRPTPQISAIYYAGMCWSIHGVSFFFAGPATFYPSLVLQGGTMALGMPLLLRAAYLFPRGVEPTHPLVRWGPWLLSILPAFGMSSGFSEPFPSRVGWLGSTFIVILGFGSVLAFVTRNWLASDPVERRQLKWAVFGAYLCLLPPLAMGLVAAVDPRWLPAYAASIASLTLFPICLFIAVTRYDLFDIDRLISAAASYNALAVLVGAGVLVAVPRAAEAASGLVGLDPDVGQVGLSLALAAAALPVHRRLRPQIERLFFRERYALDRGIAELLPALAACEDARSLTERAGAELDRLLRPEACVVYGAVEGDYAPVFVRGRAVPPAFAADSPLVQTLAKRRAPLALGSGGRRPDEAPLDPFDRAALETLGAQVVLPVHGDAGLAAFVCLGSKRSGDVYTPTDVSLLAATAETLSQQLRRFDQEQTIREGRQMQESLRRYVPGAIAEQLASGDELAPGPREVSVLFVDIRGYTRFSEGRVAEEIFSTVNRYTETVSAVVRRHGGAVVEFNGDGMMAVFGAPRELAHKERAAVEAGRALVAEVGALEVEAPGGGRTRLSVGVGVATGEAFVGNIRAVDRMIWSAIGNTTNLAARLQSLTRELEAALVIDAVTRERAGAAAADLAPRPGVPIRGRREPQDLYVLPLAAAPAEGAASAGATGGRAG